MEYPHSHPYSHNFFLQDAARAAVLLIFRLMTSSAAPRPAEALGGMEASLPNDEILARHAAVLGVLQSSALARGTLGPEPELQSP